jgi:hypothetical protein
VKFQAIKLLDKKKIGENIKNSLTPRIGLVAVARRILTAITRS